MGLDAGAAWVFGPPTPVKEVEEDRLQEDRRNVRAGKKKRSLFKNADNSEDITPETPKRSRRAWPKPMSADALQEALENQQRAKQEERAFTGGQLSKRKQVSRRAKCCGMDCASRFGSSSSSPPVSSTSSSSSSSTSATGNASTTTITTTTVTTTTTSEHADPDGHRHQHHPHQYDQGFLRREQLIFAEFVTEQDRKAFVIEHVPVAKLSKGSMMAANTPVCNRAFTKLFGVSETLISSCKRTTSARASSFIGRTPISATRDRPKYEVAISFLALISESGQHMPNTEEVFLYFFNKNEVFDVFLEHCQKIFASDPVDMNTRVCTPDYFFKTWKVRFPMLKLKPHGDFMMCQTCTLIKEKIHGQAGSRGIQDTTEIEGHKAVYMAHLEDADRDRDYSARLEMDAAIAKSRGQPSESIYIMIDAANQSSFATPLGASNAHGVDDRGYAERQKIYGILVLSDSMEVFMIPQTLGTGSNMVCTTLYTKLMELSLQWNAPLGDISIQMDNTVSENKNNHVMGFLAALVARGVARSFELHFMMVGHTHIKIDQVFSCFARAVKGRNVFSREHLSALFEDAYVKLPVKCRTVEVLANFKDLVTTVTRRIPNITKFQAFKIVREGPVVLVKVKKKMHMEDWLGFSADGQTVGRGAGFKGWRLLRVGSVRLEETPPYVLKTVDKNIVHKISQRQEASWTRLPAAFPGDTQQQAKVKAEHMDSLRILRMTGSRNFDLDTNWLPPAFGDSNESDTESDNEVDAAGLGDDGDDGDSSDDDEAVEGAEGELVRAARERMKLQRQQNEAAGIEHGRDGSFGFFVSMAAPFLVGKVKDKRVSTVTSDQGEAGEMVEVLLHWYNPSKALVANASTATFDIYANATFNAAYSVEESGSGTRGRKYVEDTSWEPVERIVATCSALISGGKKVPASVKQVLKGLDNRDAQLSEADDDNDDIQEARGQGDAGNERDERGEGLQEVAPSDRQSGSADTQEAPDSSVENFAGSGSREAEEGARGRVRASTRGRQPTRRWEDN